MPKLVIGIDARIALLHARGWARFAMDFIEAINGRPDVYIKLLYPQTSPLASLIEKKFKDLPNLELFPADFNPASPDQFYDKGMADAPENYFGSADILHSLTRFVPPTTIPCVVVTIHDIAPLSSTPFKPQYRKITESHLNRVASDQYHLVSQSEFTKTELQKWGPLKGKEISVIHPGISQRFIEESKSASGQLTELKEVSTYILYVGGAGENKNLHRLIEASKKLWEIHGASLIMAGPEFKANELLKDAPSHVYFLNAIDDCRLTELYRNANAVVLPSLHEGFGYPLIEAMVCESPLACSDIPVFREVAQEAAIYFDPLSIVDISEKLGSLIKDSRLVEHQIAKGKERISNFTWSEQIKKYQSLYRKLIP